MLQVKSCESSLLEIVCPRLKAVGSAITTTTTAAAAAAATVDRAVIFQIFAYMDQTVAQRNHTLNLRHIVSM